MPLKINAHMWKVITKKLNWYPLWFSKIDSDLNENWQGSQKGYDLMWKHLILILRIKLKTLKVLTEKGRIAQHWSIPPNTEDYHLFPCSSNMCDVQPIEWCLEGKKGHFWRGCLLLKNGGPIKWVEQKSEQPMKYWKGHLCMDLSNWNTNGWVDVKCFWTIPLWLVFQVKSTFLCVCETIFFSNNEY
jgi:hypothetical protein